MVVLPIQIVNDQDEPTGSATISEAHDMGLIHRVVRVMVHNPAGQVLLQKRVATMQNYPNCWDNSAAGHVDAGESYDVAAQGELAEEIGLRNVTLTKIGYYRSTERYSGLKLNRFNTAYQVEVPIDTVFQIQPDEVAAVQWFDIGQVRQLIKQHSDQVTDGLIEVFERYF